MQVKTLGLAGFRNYDVLTADFSPGVNLIYGENAQGKTNLLEAIACLSGARSHRAASDRELIGFGREQARLQAVTESRGQDFSLDITLRQGARRRILVDGAPRKTAAELSDYLRTVLFCPEDLALVREGAAARRRFLDNAISQLRPRYVLALGQYRRALEQKTRILRDWKEHPGLLAVLEEFNDALAKSGAVLIHYRAHFIRRLSALAGETVLDFSGGRDLLRLDYETVSTIKNPEEKPAALYPLLLEHQKCRREAELQSRQCLSGPHRDEISCLLGGKAARQFASQGQTRTIALALKLAERSLHQEDSGEWPVLLLDDVLSELDAKRQEFVLARIEDGQLFISGCEEHTRSNTARRFHIHAGQIINTA